MKTIVFGSINMDLVVNTPHLPQPGETITGRSFFTTPGGKGANQAVAAARLGTKTLMVGRVGNVGNDPFASTLLENLSENGVDVTHVRIDRNVSSGVALIAVDENGENTIVIVPGANGRVGAPDAERLEDLIKPGDVLLLQLEVPLTAVMAAARIASQRQATIILDPAPARALPSELISLAHIITPNETEAGILTGIPVVDSRSAEAAINRLHGKGSRQVLLKMGSAGATWSSGTAIKGIPAYRVDVVDTVAAGDACNGALAAGLCSGLSIGEALQWGMAAGALATTRPGAQVALPERDVLQKFIATHERSLD